MLGCVLSVPSGFLFVKGERRKSLGSTPSLRRVQRSPPVDIPAKSSATAAFPAFSLQNPPPRGRKIFPAVVNRLVAFRFLNDSLTTAASICSECPLGSSFVPVSSRHFSLQRPFDQDRPRVSRPSKRGGSARTPALRANAVPPPLPEQYFPRKAPAGWESPLPPRRGPYFFFGVFPPGSRPHSASRAWASRIFSSVIS